MKLTDLFSGQQLFDLMHGDILLSKQEIEESRNRIMHEFQPQINRCIKECGATSSDPQGEAKAIGSYFFAIDCILKMLYKDRKIQ